MVGKFLPDNIENSGGKIEVPNGLLPGLLLSDAEVTMPRFPPAAVFSI